MCLAPHDKASTACTQQRSSPLPHRHRRVLYPSYYQHYDDDDDSSSDSDSDSDDESVMEEEELHLRQQEEEDNQDEVPRVTFASPDHNQVHVIPTALSLYLSDSSDESEDDDETDTSTTNKDVLTERRRHLWYNRQDIKEFRRSASQTSKRLRDTTNNKTTTTNFWQSQDEEDDEERGLELRMSLARQDRKQMIVKRIVAASHHKTPTELAHMAQDYSQWSRQVALAQGHKDYYAVHHPGSASCVVPPELPSVLDCSRSFILANKRTSSSSFGHVPGRRVRCRMY